MSEYTPTTDEVLREKIAALSSDALRDVAYSCGRVWEAWQYGTMTQDDFSPAWEDEELLASIADALLPLIAEIRTAALEEAAVIAKSFGMVSKRNLEPYWEGWDDATDRVSQAIDTALITKARDKQ